MKRKAATNSESQPKLLVFHRLLLPNHFDIPCAGLHRQHYPFFYRFINNCPYNGGYLYRTIHYALEHTSLRLTPNPHQRDFVSTRHVRNQRRSFHIVLIEWAGIQHSHDTVSTGVLDHRSNPGAHQVDALDARIGHGGGRAGNRAGQSLHGAQSVVIDGSLAVQHRNEDVDTGLRVSGGFYPAGQRDLQLCGEIAFEHVADIAAPGAEGREGREFELGGYSGRRGEDGAGRERPRTVDARRELESAGDAELEEGTASRRWRKGGLED